MTASELDDVEMFRPYGEIHGPSALKACELAVRLDPQSAAAQEHLGRAYLASAYGGGGPAARAKAMESFSIAAGLGSAYGLVKLSEAGASGGNRVQSEALLAPLASRDNAGALLLLAELRAVDSGQLRPVNDMRRDGTLEIFSRAAKSGGGGLLSRWVIDAIRRGDCGRLMTIDPEGQKLARSPNENAELFCGTLVSYAADEGDILANLYLGLAHTQAALNFADQRQNVALWRERMNQERGLARGHLLVVKASGDQLFGAMTDRVLARLDQLEMAQDRASREFWGSVLVGGLALLAAADSGTPSAPEEPKERSQERDCQVLMADAGAGSTRAYNTAAWSGCYD